MSQNTQNDFTPISSSSGLKPVLAAALASLEVQLDQELTRYRRIRNNGKKHNSVHIPGFTEFNRQTLNPVKTDIEKNRQSTGEIVPQTREQRISLPSIPATTPPMADNNIISKHDSIQIPEKPPQPELTTASLISSIVPTKSNNTQEEAITSTQDTVKQPDDYLESSEALLRSLNDEPTQEPTSPSSPTSSSESILSPTGIGSMFLLLLASLILGYVVLNPKYLPKFNFNLSNNQSSSSISTSESTITPNNTLTSEPKTTPTTTSTNAATTVPEITPIAKYPDLASQEFKQVRDPNDVVGLKPKTKPSPVITQITPTTLTIQPPVTPIAPLPTLSPVPDVSNTTTTSPSPSISTSLTPKAKISLAPLPEDIKPGANGYYYIITDNNQDSLAAAKKVVPDAYLSPNGKYIYLGALKTKDDVQRRLQELADQGIQGRVQQ